MRSISDWTKVKKNYKICRLSNIQKNCLLKKTRTLSELEEKYYEYSTILNDMWKTLSGLSKEIKKKGGWFFYFENNVGHGYEVGEGYCSFSEQNKKWGIKRNVLLGKKFTSLMDACDRIMKIKYFFEEVFKVEILDYLKERFPAKKYDCFIDRKLIKVNLNGREYIFKPVRYSPTYIGFNLLNEHIPDYESITMNDERITKGWM